MPDQKRKLILITGIPGTGETSYGEAFDRGAIDRPQTRLAVQNILEGGELAFRRRKEIYGY